MDGILNVYKEPGFTSQDVCAKLRGILHMKKIGHTGTLDPDACGVLPVCLGQATKAVELLADRKKIYEAVLLLGRETDTQDVSGEVICERPVTVTEEETEQALLSFLGEQMQVPPMYSALKVDGKRLYELAREGKSVERAARPVTFYDITVLDITLPRVRFQVTCSKGTYIRTLCHDVGERLSCGGCMESLKRLAVGPFRVEESRTLSQIEDLARAGRIGEVLVPVDALFRDLPACTVRPGYEKFLYNGNPLREDWVTKKKTSFPEDHSAGKGEEGLSRVRLYTPDGAFFGLYEYRAQSGEYRITKRFYGG